MGPDSGPKAGPVVCRVWRDVQFPPGLEQAGQPGSHADDVDVAVGPGSAAEPTRECTAC